MPVAFDVQSVGLRTARKAAIGLFAGLLLTVFSAVESEGRSRQHPADSGLNGSTSSSSRSGSTVAQSQLPVEAKATLKRVRTGGPFPFANDGVVFGNRERHLPVQSRGFYKEYTVVTPGSRDRGARRIVCGGQPTAPESCYYTGDHYNSFKQIVE